MNRQIRIFLLAFSFFAICIQNSQGCGEDCPGDCEDKYKCVDRSELCHEMRENCENFFFRKCMRCACPKTCGVCGDSSSSEEEELTTKTTPRTTSTIAPTNGTEPPTSPGPSSSTPEEPSSPEPPSTPEMPITSPKPVESSTVEEISDAEFNDPVKMKCKSCDAKRKKLAEIYDKYYPKE